MTTKKFKQINQLKITPVTSRKFVDGVRAVTRVDNPRDVKFNQQKTSLYQTLITAFRHFGLSPNFGVKLVSLMTLLLINATLLHYTGISGAYYNDTENGSGNFQAGILTGVATSTADFAPLLTPTSTVSRIIDFTSSSTMDIQYLVTATTSIPQLLCDNILLSASVHGSSTASTSLATFSFLTPLLGASSTDSFDFTGYLASSSPALENQLCHFNFIFTAWQTNIPNLPGGFNDEKIVPATIMTGSWTATSSLPAVIINEVFWMGSKIRFDDTCDPDNALNVKNVNDEWVELYNTTDEDIDLAHWRIYNIQYGLGGHLEIPEQHGHDRYIIPAHGFFLISHFHEDSSSIKVEPDYVWGGVNIRNDYLLNGQIALINASGTLMDATPIPETADWPAGKFEEDKRWSMERNDSTAFGTATSSWHTCDPGMMTPVEVTLMHTYWDSNALDYNCGTPSNPNLSFIPEPEQPAISLQQAESVRGNNSGNEQSDSDSESDSNSVLPLAEESADLAAELETAITEPAAEKTKDDLEIKTEIDLEADETAPQFIDS